jgi:hypothetical protein
VYANAPSTLVWVGAYLEVLAYLLLFAFVARLWATLREADGYTPNWLATAAVGAGLLSVALTLAGFAIGTVLHYRGGPGLNLQAALALFDVHVALYVASWALGAMFLGCTAAIVIGWRVLPRWLGFLAAVIAVFDLVAMGLPTSPLAQFPSLFLLLWVLAASVMLLQRRRTNASAEALVTPIV